MGIANSPQVGRIKLYKGDITGVKVTIKQNTKSSYPAAYISYSKLKR
ncbi:hypothetical protein P4V47_11750 [Brevibacillus laterosporus]|nr:hypothetical protein [Brevibacillus laterosporus]